ncbi:WD40 repeat-like protein [Macroventuria anomochaeta]|uniref:WD40 repeat-like protein n=1 Tax=Macroventuria anomochaeta TaxID=301207 RepID=A0ACB6RIZ7_9PLEO|nr:WD40 repeat-like protein [Macroventuria anomochaeta]KAF2621718.1 WD40 repeat-like protein [Macroventuria anomochaeta]
MRAPAPQAAFLSEASSGFTADDKRLVRDLKPLEIVRLASASDDETVRVWDAKTGQPVHTLNFSRNIVRPTHILNDHIDRYSSVAFSAAGDRLALASWDKTVRVWDAKTGQPLHTLELTNRVRKVAFSRDGAHLKTSRGSMLLPLATLSTSTFPPKSSVERIFVGHSWLTVNSQDTLWIPADCRPSHTDVHSCRVAFGYTSGRVLLLELW